MSLCHLDTARLGRRVLNPSKGFNPLLPWASRRLSTRNSNTNISHTVSNQHPHPPPNDAVHANYPPPPRRPRYLRPGIWAVTVASGLYATFALVEGRQRAKTPEHAGIIPSVRNAWQRQRRPPSELEFPGTQDLSTWFREMNPVTKLTFGLVGVNGAIQLGEYLTPVFWFNLWHIPTFNRNYTLLSSAFVHSGVGHLFFNMYALTSFMPTLGYTRLFEGNAWHLAAFYVSSAVVASYAQHLTTLWQVSARAGMFAGASGALFALIAALAVQHPDMRFGIIFLPFSFSAQDGLTAAMLFDLFGVTVGMPRLRLGHGAHLGGALAGIAYAYYDGKTNLWQPLCRSFENMFRSMTLSR